MRRRLLSLLPLVAASAMALGQAIDPNAAAATVNGESITMADYLRRLEWFRPDPNSALASYPAGFQVLRQMISERMILQLAKSRGVPPTSPQIDARVAEMMRDEPNLKTKMVEAGATDADLREQLTSQEAQFNLMTAGITITDQEIEKHYKDNPSEFREPARYKLRIVAVGDDDTQAKVDEALRANRPFADVAKEFSLDPATKSMGGEYGEVPETSLADATRRAIEVTPVGSTSVWIKGANSQARVKFLVEAATPSKTNPLDDALKGRIRRRMMLDKGAVKNNADVQRDLEAATRAAQVTIAQPQFQKMYTELLDRLKKPQG